MATFRTLEYGVDSKSAFREFDSHRGYMKLILFIIFLFFSVVTKSQSLEIEKPIYAFIQHKLDLKKDTIYGGKIEWFHAWDYEYYTFIVTDSVIVPVYGMHELKKNEKLYIVFPDKKRQRDKATIIWESDMKEHVIKR